MGTGSAVSVGLGFEVIAATWANQLDPSIALAATAAGWRGVFDLEYADAGDDRTWEALHRYARSCPGPLGLKLRGDATWLIERLPSAIVPRLGTVILTSTDAAILGQHAAALRAAASGTLRLLLEVVSPEEAVLGATLGSSAIIAKGSESAGHVGECTSFILLQRLRPVTALPIFAQGGIGVHTVAAAYVAGAAGVVLDQQLLLAREARLP